MRVAKLLAATILVSAATSSSAEPASAPEVLQVGIDHDFPPFEFLDEAGEATGFSVELMRAIAALHDFEVEFVAGPWHAIRDELEAGRLDVAPSMVLTEERDLLLDFSTPTILVEHRLFVLEDSEIETPQDVLELGVAVQLDTIWHDRLLEHFPEVPRTTHESATDVLHSVSEGRAPSGVLVLHQRLYLARRHGIDNLRTLGDPLLPQQYRFAVPEGRRELLRSLNDGLLEVTASGTYDELYDRWLGVLRDEGTLTAAEQRWLVGVGGVLAAFLIIALLWSRTLQSQLDRRTGELRKEEERSRSLERRLLQDQKMEALGRLAAGVAHDFNNLLSLILGNVALARGETSGKEPLEFRLKRIQEAGESGVRVVQQLLTFSRRQEIEPRALSWNDVLRDSREMLERSLTRAIRVHLDLAEDLWLVRLDPGQALQVVMNLLINARDAIASTGNVWVETENVTRGSSFVRLTVRDDGHGMDDQTRRSIFEPFFTTKAEGRGTGLGLATVYGIVEQNDGSIEVESQPGEGTRFEILLPRASEDSGSV